MKNFYLNGHLIEEETRLHKLKINTILSEKIIFELKNYLSKVLYLYNENKLSFLFIDCSLFENDLLKIAHTIELLFKDSNDSNLIKNFKSNTTDDFKIICYNQPRIGKKLETVNQKYEYIYWSKINNKSLSNLSVISIPTRIIGVYSNNRRRIKTKHNDTNELLCSILDHVFKISENKYWLHIILQWKGGIDSIEFQDTFVLEEHINHLLN